MAITRNKIATIAGFDIILDQRGPDNFTVHYGKQVDGPGLTYAQAAEKLGQVLMHALSCDGAVDNRTKSEVRRNRGASLAAFFARTPFIPADKAEARRG